MLIPRPEERGSRLLEVVCDDGVVDVPLGIKIGPAQRDRGAEHVTPSSLPTILFISPSKFPSII